MDDFSPDPNPVYDANFPPHGGYPQPQYPPGGNQYPPGPPGPGPFPPAPGGYPPPAGYPAPPITNQPMAGDGKFLFYYKLIS